MTTVYNALPDLQLGLAAIFLCIGFGFLVLSASFRKVRGPVFWALAFLSNAVGFTFWSGTVPLGAAAYLVAGEIFHIVGFYLLVVGALVFGEIKVSPRIAVPFVAVWILAWAASILCFGRHPYLAGLSLKLLRASVLLICGFFLMAGRKDGDAAGRRIAGSSLVAWSLYIVLSAFVRINGVVYYGFLVGFQILAAFGMVAMLVDRIRTNIDTMERKVEQLEGILPICSYCKKIRDENDEWHVIEEYIETRSKAEFSHGICPECFARHRPDR
ncbi:MAG: hypothetical protein JXA15_08570 [Spirochaetales bacterium]|nr:hypothetical protein [Spirochaetales bacterium]